MEPVGASASILTLLGATGESCKFIYNLYVDLSDAPKDIQTQTKKFQSFNLTIQQLIVAYEKLPSDFEVDIRLQKEIATFQIEVTSMKIRLERRFDAMRQSRSLRWKECCKWLLFDRQLNKFLNTMDHWYMIMNQAATIAQMSVVFYLGSLSIANISIQSLIDTYRSKRQYSNGSDTPMDVMPEHIQSVFVFRATSLTITIFDEIAFRAPDGYISARTIFGLIRRTCRS